MPRRSPRQITSAQIETATASDFSGGWNAAESQLSFNSRFSVIEDNLYYGINGTLQVRQGTELFADLETIATADFVDGWFFYAYIISVASDGTVYATDGTGASAQVWPNSIGNWSTTDAVTFVEMNGDLIIHNGVNKPIKITSALVTTFLTDLDGTNLDVPIGLVASKHGDWHVIAVVDELNISHTRSPGTFEGDPAPNIATTVPLKSRVTRGSTTIRAMISYRDSLLVMFDQCIVPVTIAVNDAGDALVVTIDDTIDNYGAISHRVVQNLGDDALFCDIVGVQSVARTVFTKTLTPSYESQLIAKPLQKALEKLSTDTLQKKLFSVFDTNEKAYMLFIPNDDNPAAAYETVCYIKIDQTKPKKVEAWARFKDWKWSYACRSAEGNIFFGKGKQIYLMGRDEIRTKSLDYIGDQEMFSDDTTFTDHTGFTPVADIDDSGIPIRFTREFPWSFMKKRENKKINKFVSVDTEGSSPFTLKLFIDNFYEDPDSFGELFTDDTEFTDGTGFLSLNPDLAPQLEMEFVGRDALQYGGQTFGNSPYGGGRSTADTRLYKFPAKFKLMKLRMEGEAKEGLKLVAVTLSYQMGSIRRGS